MFEREPQFGVNVIGYLQSVLGVGEIARQAIAALDTANVPTLPVRLSSPATADDQPFLHVPRSRAVFPINLICANAELMPALATDAEGLLRGRYSIGWWWWEVSRFRESLAGSFAFVDEVWAGSSFVADALAAVAPVPVITVPVPIDLPAGIRADRPGFDFGHEEFVFLFVFDYNSVVKRKNPLGLIDAFTTAFGPSSGATLVLKCINEQHNPAAHELLSAAAAPHPHVRVIGGYLTEARKNSLIASCDCYVSLHRSEGFGIILAEAMWLAKPVIATGYSGNMDYMSVENSYLVDCALVRIGDGAAPYPVDGVWAEPDLGDAVAQMRHVFEHRDEAAERGVRAARDIRDQYGLAAASTLIHARLARIHEQLADRVRSVRVAGLPDTVGAHQLVSRGPQPPARSAIGPLGPSARRAALRLMKPFTAHERQVDTLVLNAIDELSAALGRLTSSVSAEVVGRLALIEADVLRHLRASTTEFVKSQQPASEAHEAELSTRLAGLERQISELRELVERIPDWIENWPRRLADLRASDQYARAFSGDPLITVRIATYTNTDELLERALASVQRQTYSHWEVRIVGDHCNDDVAERLTALDDSRISFRNRSVRGPYPEDPSARWLVTGTYPYNEALAEARGAWIAPLDDDDEWTDDHLEVLLRAAQATGAELVYGAMRVVIEDTERETWFGAWPPQMGDFAFQSAIYHGGLRNFRYDTHAHLRGVPADWDLAQRMLESGVQFHFIERLVGTYHVADSDHHAQWWRERARDRPPWGRSLEG